MRLILSEVLLKAQTVNLQLMPPRFSLYSKISKITGMQPQCLAPSILLAPITSLLSDSPRWIERLPELFKQFNLENIEKVFAFEQPWQSKMAADMSCAVVNEMGNSGSPFVTEKLKNFGVSIPLAYSEVAKGARLTQPFCVTVGRKTL